MKNCSLPMAKHSPEFEGLLRYLHEKATILYFSEVESMVILSPYWLLRLFSYTITAYSYVWRECDEAYKWLTKYGFFHDSLLQHMLDKFHAHRFLQHSKNHTRNQVIDILLHFNIIVHVTREAWFSEGDFPLLPEQSDTFIVPFLVSYDNEKNPPNTTQQRKLYFKFDDSFVPIGLLNKLIAKCICRNVKKRSKLLW